MFKKLLDEGLRGQRRIALRGTEKEDVERGQVVCKREASRRTEVQAEAYVLTKERGRHTPFFSGYRPHFISAPRVTRYELRGREMVMPGDNVSCEVT